MNALTANPSAYILPLLALLVVVGYYGYGALDRLGLPSSQAEAVVTGKTFTPGTTTYNTVVAAGRSWTQSNRQPDFYAISLTVNGEPTVALVDKTMFEQLNAGDRVRVEVRRTRFSGKLLVGKLTR